MKQCCVENSHVEEGTSTKGTQIEAEGQVGGFYFDAICLFDAAGLESSQANSMIATWYDENSIVRV